MNNFMIAKLKISFKTFLILLSMFSINILLADNSEESVKSIIESVNNRNSGINKKSEMQMILTNKHGKQRKRSITLYSQKSNEKTKNMMIFNEPRNVKGTSFLTWEHNTDKEDDRWLYMPSYKKVRRIGGSSKNDYFMGTDFTYADLKNKFIYNDSYSITGNDTIDNKECWIISAEFDTKDEIYSKKIIWIQKETRLPVKIEYYDENGLMKTFNAENISKINNIWTVNKMVMNNFRNSHKTELILKNINYEADLPENLFTVSRMERGLIH